jgi:hypothetical protein
LARLRAAYRKASPAQRVALQAPKHRAKERRATLRQEIDALQQAPGSDRDRVQTLAALSHEGGATATPAQGDIVQRLVQRVDYDGRRLLFADDADHFVQRHRCRTFDRAIGQASRYIGFVH